MNNIALNVKEILNADICVLGGSCTGVFAAVRAARLGARVALIEKQNSFGGVATQGLVTIWHTLQNMADDRRIIGGLTWEMISRLKERGGVDFFPQHRDTTYTMNTEELKLELDGLVAAEKNITPLFHAMYSCPYTENGKLTGVVVTTKSGIGLIKADFFIDATGDADLIRDLPQLETYVPSHLQPPSPGMKISGMKGLCYEDFINLIRDHAEEAELPKDVGWGSFIPGDDGLFFFCPTHIYGVNCADAFELTKAELESRKHIKGIMDLLRKYYPQNKSTLAAVDSYIGVRETRHVKCLHRLTEDEILGGTRYEDAIARGTYRVDIHSATDHTLTFKYLDGRQVVMENGKESVVSSWLKVGQTGTDYYEIPLGCIIPKGSRNVLCAGRMIDADMGAFGAVRVMVNMNQLGEAAGVCAFDCLDKSKDVLQADAKEVRKLLCKGESLLQ